MELKPDRRTLSLTLSLIHISILDGREKLDLEIFESAFLRNLGMVSEYISELSAKPVVKRQAKTCLLYTSRCV